MGSLGFSFIFLFRKSIFLKKKKAYFSVCGFLFTFKSLFLLASMVGQNMCLDFPWHHMENPKWTFRSTQHLGSLGLEPLICAPCLLSVLTVLGMEQAFSARGALAVSQPNLCFLGKRKQSPRHSDFPETQWLIDEQNRGQAPDGWRAFFLRLP